MKLGVKLLLAFLAVGIIPLAATGLICLKHANYAIEKQVINQLESVCDIKRVQIESFFKKQKKDMEFLIQTIDTFQHQAMNKLLAVQQIKKNQIEKYFKSIQNSISTIKDNPFIRDRLLEFDSAFMKAGDSIDSPEWRALSLKWDELFKKLCHDLEFEDILLMCPEGSIVYTHLKEPDLGLFVDKDPLNQTTFGDAFRTLKHNPELEVVFGDFAPYAPSNQKLTGFIMARLRNDNGEVVGHVAGKVSKDKINEIVQQRDGMGKTGESFIVGKYNGKITYRSDRVVKSGKMGEPISGQSINQALSGKSGFLTRTNKQGNLDIESYTALTIQNLNWGLINTINLQEVIVPRISQSDFYNQYIQTNQYSDFYLIHPTGTIFYSVQQEKDYLTNIINGPYANSGLGKLVQHVLKEKQFAIADYEPYAPSNNEPIAFIAAPIMDNHDIELIVALKLNLNTLNHVMHQKEGMGETGETFLIGSDKRMRSDSLIDPEFHSVKASFENSEKGLVDTTASNEALNGQKGTAISENYIGKPVLSAYCPLKIYNLSWALIAEIDQSEAFNSIHSMKNRVLIVVVIAIVFIVAIAFFLTWNITNPIKRILSFIHNVQNGDTKVTLDSVSKDEIGEMGTALNDMVIGSRRLIYNLDHLPIPVIEVDKKLTMKYLNHAALNLFDNQKQDMVGKKCHDYLKTKICKTSKCCAAVAMASNQEHIDDTILDPEKHDLPIRYTGFPIKDSKGNISGSLLSFMDISGEREIKNEIVHIIQAINQGNISVRGNEKKFSGSYGEIVVNVNRMVESLIKPITLAVKSIESISNGIIPEPITETYEGEFDRLKSNINVCFDAINRLVSDASMLVNACIEGRLDTRAVVESHKGIFSNIIMGINQTMDAIIHPIKEAQILLNKMADGNLSEKFDGEYKGDHTIIKNAINNTLDSLNSILNQATSVTTHVADAASQLEKASQSLSQHIQAQTASVEKISSSLHQTESQIKLNADNAKTANNLVSETNQAAMAGQEEMKLMTTAMMEINHSSQNISKIIKVIDEIAFQTNILALNAAVEAARAGHHGKGFAVVAQEVRNLAARSAQASKETAEMIEESNKKVLEGVNIANRTSDALEQIVDNVIKVRDLVSEIATASNEQSNAISEVNDGMKSICTVTEAISSQCEQTSSSALQLKTQAQELKDQLSIFYLNKSCSPQLNESIDLKQDEPIDSLAIASKGSSQKNEKKRQIDNHSTSMKPIKNACSRPEPFKLSPKPTNKTELSRDDTHTKHVSNKKISEVDSEKNAMHLKQPQSNIPSKNKQNHLSPKEILPLDMDEKGFGDF